MRPNSPWKFCVTKKTINKTKGQLTEWVKVFANHKNDQEMISKVYKQVIKLTIKKQTTQLRMCWR